MPLQMVVTGSERDDDDHRRPLEAAFSQYLGKLRRVHIEKTRRGQSNAKLLQEYEVAREPDEDGPKLVAQLVESILEIITNDASGVTARQKYFVVLLTDSLVDTMPELTRVPIITEPDDAPAPSRDSEMIAMFGSLKDYCQNLQKEYLKLAQAAPAMVIANATTAAELGAALATATVTSHEWEYKKMALEADARIAVAEVESRVLRSDRMWSTFDHFFDELAPYFDIAAAEFASARDGGGDSHQRGGPTKAEIDTVFGNGDPDVARLAHEFMAASGHEAAALKQALRERWDAMSDDAKKSVMGQFQKLERGRMMAIGAWMKRNGIGQTPSGK